MRWLYGRDAAVSIRVLDIYPLRNYIGAAHCSKFKVSPKEFKRDVRIVVSMTVNEYNIHHGSAAARVYLLAVSAADVDVERLLF